MSSLFVANRIFLVAIALGIFFGCCSFCLFNRLPEKWFCDYGQENVENTVPQGSCRRLCLSPWLFLFCFILCLAWVLLLKDMEQKGFSMDSLQEKGWQIGTKLLSVGVLLQVAVSDVKYRIIPDQHVVLLSILGLALPLLGRAEWGDQILGGILGGTVVLLTAVLGRGVYRRECIGFGDVKLMAAVGFLVGKEQLAVIFVLTVFSSAGLFLILLLKNPALWETEQPLAPFISFAAFTVICLSP